MNEKFFDLPKEKQDRIINGALYVFSRYEYKKASTDEIVKRAGISKGLLFHYFNNKKGLYVFIYNYSTDFFFRESARQKNGEETDFFKILINAQKTKLGILQTYPDIMNFMVKAYYEEAAEVKGVVSSDYLRIMTEARRSLIERADTSKFKEGIDPEMVLDIIVWMGEGFMQEYDGTHADSSELKRANSRYLEYVELLRHQFYKEEFL